MSFAVPRPLYVSDSDYGAYNDNELYVNVHSANNPNGEVRGQLRSNSVASSAFPSRDRARLGGLYLF